MDQRYRKTFDQISLPEDKAQAMRSCLAAQCSQEKSNQEVLPMKKNKPFRRSRIIVAAAVAALLLSLGTAGATGALKSVSEAFAGWLGASPDQTQLLEGMGHSIGVSDTADGLTISVDAIIGDESNYVIVYSITPEEGTTLPLPGYQEGEKEDLYLTYRFYEDGFPDMCYSFYDADPSDPSIQFTEEGTCSDGVPKGSTTRTFENLYFGTHEQLGHDDTDLIAAGPWKLTFSLDYEDSSLRLATDQAIPLNGETVMVDSISISPLGVTIKGSLDNVIDWKDDVLNSDPFASYEDAPLGRAILNLPISLTMKDGSTMDTFYGDSSSIGDKDGKTCYTRISRFIEITPLDTIESVTIGELTIPLEQASS